MAFVHKRWRPEKTGLGDCVESLLREVKQINSEPRLNIYSADSRLLKTWYSDKHCTRPVVTCPHLHLLQLSYCLLRFLQ